MSVLPIVRLGHPALRTPAEAVPEEKLGSEPVQRLIDDMVETMHAAEGVGLAAPQVGVSWQLFAYEAADPDDPARGIPLHVVVNPMIGPEGHEQVEDWEGCLSIPDLRGLVPRPSVVRVRGFDRTGQPLDYRAEGFEARIVQHEFDHLNGVVFLDRMRDFRTLSYLDEWELYLAGRNGDPDETAVG
jgi:peptide deformylase